MLGPELAQAQQPPAVVQPVPPPQGQTPYRNHQPLSPEQASVSKREPAREPVEGLGEVPDRTEPPAAAATVPLQAQGTVRARASARPQAVPPWTGQHRPAQGRPVSAPVEQTRPVEQKEPIPSKRRQVGAPPQEGRRAGALRGGFHRRHPAPAPAAGPNPAPVVSASAPPPETSAYPCAAAQTDRRAALRAVLPAEPRDGHEPACPVSRPAGSMPRRTGRPDDRSPSGPAVPFAPEWYARWQARLPRHSWAAAGCGGSRKYHRPPRHRL